MIIRFILFLIILYLLYCLAKGILRINSKSSKRVSERPTQGEDLVEDPICHTYVPISEAFELMMGNKTVYFCSRECSEKYKSDAMRR
jgi:YHS domain-containing protein